MNLKFILVYSFLTNKSEKLANPATSLDCNFKPSYLISYSYLGWDWRKLYQWDFGCLRVLILTGSFLERHGNFTNHQIWNQYFNGQYAIPKINVLDNLSCCETRFRLLCRWYLLHSSLYLAFRQCKLHSIFIFEMAHFLALCISKHNLSCCSRIATKNVFI